MAGQKWTREETLVALNIYCRTPFGRLNGHNPEIVEIAKALGRTPSALGMKCCNLAAFDPSLAVRGIKGLPNASKLDREIWQEFTDHPEETAFESEQAVARLSNNELRAETEVCWEDVRGLDSFAVTKVRVNQHFFRSVIITGYRERCAVCEVPFKELLVASHIVPWSVDKSERMNPTNGICLCATHDRAFDRGLLQVSAEYIITLSEMVWKHRDARSVQEQLLQFNGRQISLPDRWCPASRFLIRHSEIISNLAYIPDATI
jgi:putative restriction endonuclease